MQKVRTFSNIFRFIYDLCTFNNHELKNHYIDIYLDELKLRKENEDPCKASFLDHSIEAHDRKKLQHN